MVFRAIAAITSTLALLSLATATASAAPVGRFRVEGINPGGKGTYAGTVRVRKTGELYDVQWQVDQRRYFGVGLEKHGVFTVAYTSEEGGWLGVGVYRREGDTWIGTWGQFRGEAAGMERWRP